MDTNRVTNLFVTILHMLFDSIDQTVTKDVKGLRRNHKHVAISCHAVPTPATVLSNQRQANKKHAYISRVPRLIIMNYCA